MRLDRVVARYGQIPVVGSAVLVAAMLLLLAASWRAFQIQPLPAPAALDAPASPRIAANDADREAPELTALLDGNPFHPERRRPGARYELPAEDSESAEAPPSSDVLVLTGTILYPDGGGAAIVKQGRQPSQIVRRGAAYGALTLTSVERGKATFTASDGTPVVLVSAEEGGS